MTIVRFGWSSEKKHKKAKGDSLVQERTALLRFGKAADTQFWSPIPYRYTRVLKMDSVE